MKVLFLINSIPPDYGGGYLRVFRMAARFKQSGWFYRIATFTQQKGYKTETLGITQDDILFYSYFSSWITESFRLRFMVDRDATRMIPAMMWLQISIYLVDF